MEDFVREPPDDPKICPPCVMAPLASYYLATLKKAGEIEQAKILERAWEKTDILTIAQAMDKIKKEVGDDLKKELESFDCFAQSFKQEVED
jgi:hypothetical protein